MVMGRPDRPFRPGLAALAVLVILIPAGGSRAHPDHRHLDHDGAIVHDHLHAGPHQHDRESEHEHDPPDRDDPANDGRGSKFFGEAASIARAEAAPTIASSAALVRARIPESIRPRFEANFSPSIAPRAPPCTAN